MFSAIEMNNLLGAPLYMHGLDTVMYPEFDDMKRYEASRTQQELDSTAAMLVPMDAILMTIVRQGASLYIHTTTHSDTRWHLAHAFGLVCAHFPDDSAVQCLQFQDKNGMNILGLFDCSRLHGKDMSDTPPITRHILLRENFQEHYIINMHVTFLWVGVEASCVHTLLDQDASNHLPFKVKCIARVPINIKEDAFTRLLPPLCIPRH